MPMEYLWSSPYSLTAFDEITAEVLAHNSRGWSVNSGPSTSNPTVQTGPGTMVAPTSGSSTTSTQIDIEWTTLSTLSTVTPNNGGSTVTSYILYWDQGTSTWTEIVGKTSAYLGTSYLVSSGLTAGSTY
jgi:hypothetical protein